VIGTIAPITGVTELITGSAHALEIRSRRQSSARARMLAVCRVVRGSGIGRSGFWIAVARLGRVQC
jgi:hypothetical protein